MITFNGDENFIVTGASSGIGASLALLLNKLGANVIGIGRDEERLVSIKNKSCAPERLHVEKKDLAEDVAALPTYVKDLKNKYGKFKGMAYCAGMGGINPLRSVEIDEIRSIFEINYFAPVFMAKGFADKRNHVPGRSSMVFIASAGGVHCDPGMTSYSGSKGALIASMQSIARELASAEIRVNCVSPTLIDTGMAGKTERQFAEGKYPFGIGKAEDVASMIAYMLSEQAQFISAQNFILDSGGVL